MEIYIKYVYMGWKDELRDEFGVHFKKWTG